MKHFVFLLLLIISNFGFAQDSLVCFSFDKKSEKRIQLLQMKTEQGEFEDALALSSVIRKKYSTNPYVKLQATILQANIHTQQLAFNSSKESVKEAWTYYREIDNINLKSSATLIFAEYFLDQNRTKEANQLLSNFKFESSMDSVVWVRHQLDLAKLHVQMGSYKSAEKILRSVGEIENNIYSNAFFQDKYNKEFSILLWARCKLLWLELFHQSGNEIKFNETFKNTQIEFSKKLTKSHPSTLQLYSLEGKHHFQLRRFNAASNAFYKAYSQGEQLDEAAFKISQLKWMILSFQKSGDLIHSQNYSRRLLMFATQKSGYYDRFQLAYNFTVANDELQKGNIDLAKSRLQLTLKEFDHIPSYSEDWKDLQNLQLEISLKEGDIKSYLSCLSSALEETDTIIGSNSIKFHQAQLEIANAELRYGKRFKWVKEIYSNSYDKEVKNEIGWISNLNRDYLTNYSELYLKLDQFDSARSKAKQALQISASLSKRIGSNYAAAIAHFVECNLLAGFYKEALDSMALLPSVKLNIGESEEQQSAMLAITGIYNFLGEFDKSSKLLAEANNSARKDVYDRNITLVAQSAAKQAALLILAGNYFKAEKILQEAIAQVIVTLGKNSPKLIELQEELISLYITTGNFSECSSLLDRTSILIDSVYGNKSLIKSELYVRQGDYLLQIGDLKGAEDSYKKSDQLLQQILGKKHLRRSETLLRLAYLQTLKPGFKVAEVESLYKEVLDIIKQSIGTTNPLYAETLERYALLLIKNSGWEKATQVLNEADNFWIQKLGNDNAHSTNISVLKGDIQYAKMQYSEAEKSYQTARRNYKDLFNDKHPSYLKVSGKLARTHYMMGEANQALFIMDDIIPKYLDFTTNYFPSLSFRQKSKFWNNLKEEFEFYNAVVFSRPAAMIPLYTGKVYNNVLNTKALLLSSSIKLLEKILNSNDSTLIATYNQWVAEKEFLINAMNLSKQSLQEQGISLSDIEANAERLEKEMAQRSELFASENDNHSPTWLKVKSSLMPGEVAIEIVRYRTFNKTFTDSVCYAALIVRNEKLKLFPEYVLMGNGSMMEGRYLKYYRNCSVFDTKDEYSYSIYWKAIKSKLKEKELVYLSSDGVYNQLNLEMLPDSNGTYLIDQNQLVLLTNTRDLITSSKQKGKESKKKSGERFVLCGSPEFYTTKTPSKNVQDLPGAEKEINEIYNLLATSSRDSWKLLNAQVEEDTIKKLVSPKVLHIATHGYFKEVKSDALAEDDITTNPLLNSGILLRGSGDILDNKSNTYVNQKDGILTALEAMDMNLDKTDLVILSACETGRGSVQAGEGVYGLQRSFLLAGSKAVIISLFKVNDEVTQKLMLSFYTKWLATGDKRQAFVDAKREIKETYHKPINWGAFIMIEGKPDRMMKN